MRTWDDFVTREDLETEAGTVDREKVRALSLNTYLQYIGDFLELGGNNLPNVAAEQVEDFMTNDFMSVTHALEGRWPEPEEIREHLRKPENAEARKYWTYICVHATKENWPDFVKQLREKWNIPEEIEIRNEPQRKQQAEQAAKERTWTVREL